jgi:hypothetical protein
MSRLNSYLHQIGAAESDQCACTQASETVGHFLFRHRLWDAVRLQMLQYADTMRGNLSFSLGGKTTTDGDEWAPNTEAVQATVRFAIATGRLKSVPHQTPASQAAPGSYSW